MIRRRRPNYRRIRALEIDLGLREPDPVDDLEFGPGAVWHVDSPDAIRIIKPSAVTSALSARGLLDSSYAASLRIPVADPPSEEPA